MFGFCDIQNNQDPGGVYHMINLTETLIILDITKTSFGTYIYCIASFGGMFESVPQRDRRKF